MTVGILIISHGEVGQSLLKVARETMGKVATQASALGVVTGEDPEQLLQRATALVDELESGGGVIVFTDLYGSTPSNVAVRLAGMDRRVRVIAGVNLPMLIRLMNYASLDIEELVEKVVSGGREGIFLVDAQAH